MGPQCFKQKTEVTCPQWVRKTVGSDGGGGSRAGLLGHLGPGRKARGRRWMQEGGLDKFSAAQARLTLCDSTDCRVSGPESMSLKSPAVAGGFFTTSTAWDAGSIPGSGRSLGEGNDYPLQYSCLENPIDRGAWRATVPGVPKSGTQLSNTFTFILSPSP